MASHPGITESMPVRGTPKSSEEGMSPCPPIKYHRAEGPHVNGTFRQKVK